MFKTCVFSAGRDGVAYYRIPSLICTRKGTLIAAADARLNSVKDNPNKIDKVMRLSLDSGETWSKTDTIVTYSGESAAIDPAMVEDTVNGIVWMFYTHTPEGVGLFSAQAGTGFDTEGKKMLFDAQGGIYHLDNDGTVIDEHGEVTSYKVNINGDVSKEGVPTGNIYLNKGSLLEMRTSFLQAVTSKDDGNTWSEPIDLNSQVKADWMRSMGPGGGIGIQLKSSKYFGRLLMPVYFTNKNNFMSCCLIYSDDNGATWNRGTSPNDSRIFDGKRIDSKTLDIEETQLSEAQVVELNNGNVVMYMRNHTKIQRTAVSVSCDGGVTWGEVFFDATLVSPTCQSSVIRYPGTGDILIWSNPADEFKRIMGTVRISMDAGKSWEINHTVEKSFFAYSSLAVLANGEIGLLYETDEYKKIIFARLKFPFGDIEEK